MPISRHVRAEKFHSATEPEGRTVLCAELPSDPGQPEWDMTTIRTWARGFCGWMEKRGPAEARKA